MHNLRILLLICLVAGQDNIIPVFERLSARKCIHRLSPEHDNLSGRLLSEHLMICRNPHQQLPFIANRPSTATIRFMRILLLSSNCDRDVIDLLPGHIIVCAHVVSCELIKILDLRI